MKLNWKPWGASVVDNPHSVNCPSSLISFHFPRFCMGIFQFDHAPEGVKVTVGTGSSLGGFHQSSSSSSSSSSFPFFCVQCRATLHAPASGPRRKILPSLGSWLLWRPWHSAVDATEFTKQIRHQAAVILISAHLHMRVLPCNVLRHADELHSQLFHWFDETSASDVSGEVQSGAESRSGTLKSWNCKNSIFRPWYIAALLQGWNQKRRRSICQKKKKRKILRDFRPEIINSITFSSA